MESMKLESLLQISQLVESSDVYKNWKSSVPDSFLVSMFALFAPPESPKWHLTFFNPEKKSAISFLAMPFVKQEGEDVTYGERNPQVKSLQIDRVRISAEQAFNVALQEKEKINHHTLSQVIILLMQQEKPVWNITFLTAVMTGIACTVDAISGEVLQTKTSKLYQ